MKKPPAPIRDNAVLLACLGAAVVVNVALLYGFQKSMAGQVVLVVGGAAPVVPPSAKPAAPKPAEKKPADKAPEKKPQEKPPEKKPPEKPVQKPPEKKPEPKRTTTEKKPEAAKPPAKANPGDADLAPLKLEAPEPMSVDMAQLLRVEIENRGTAPAAAHRDALYFSLDGKLDGKAVPVGAIEAGGTLAPGEKRWLRAQILLPDKTPSGRAYLIVVLNADGAMPETNHANNQLVVPVMVDASHVPLGDPNARPRTTVAWISSDDFRKLKARQSTTLQPIVQNETDAQKTATLNNQPGIAAEKPVLGEVKPKPPVQVAEKPAEKAPKLAPVETHKGGSPGASVPGAQAPAPTQAAAVPPAKPVETALDTKPAAKPPEPKADPKPAVAQATPGKGLSPAPKPAPQKTPPETPKTPEKTVASAAGGTPAVPVGAGTGATKPEANSPKAAGPADAAPKPQEPAKPAAASTGEGATSAPRAASSAPATQLEESDIEQQPGRVLVGKGVKINTARIQSPGAAALASGLTANPRVAATFNENGEVVKAEILRSSGNFGWDHQVLLSVQRWTAEGEEVKKGGLVIRWTILLGGGGGD